MKGRKDDQLKSRWDLLLWREIREVVDVLTYGAEKYDDNNWRQVSEHHRRYFAAAQRHILAWWDEESYDPESGFHHLAHAICCLLFLMWFDKEKRLEVEPEVGRCSRCKGPLIVGPAFFGDKDSGYVCWNCSGFKQDP